MSDVLTCRACGWCLDPYRPCENCARLKREAEHKADTGPKPGSIFYTPRNDIDRRLHKRRMRENGYSTDCR